MALSSPYPKLAYISAIDNAIEATVTFTEEHDYTPGQIVSFRVGQQFGMSEINNLKGKVLLTAPNTITVNINTYWWTPFTLANLNEPGTSPPCCVPSCSGVVPFEENPEVNIKDAFDNRRV